MQRTKFLLIGLLFFICSSNIFSQNRFTFSPQIALSIFNSTLEEINDTKPGGVLGYNSESQKKIISIKYNDDWFGIGNFKSEFVSAPGSKLLQIIFHFPPTIKFDEICKKVTKVLGEPSSKGKSPEAIASKRYSNWVIGGLTYNVHDYVDSIKFLISESKFWSYGTYQLSPRTYTLCQLVGDVVGDKIKRTIYLVGRRADETALYFDQLYFIIEQDQNTVGKLVKLPEEFGGGYDAKLQLIDFTGDRLPELFISAETGGSGGIINYFVYSFKNNKPELLFNPEFKCQVEIEAGFLSNFKASITIINTKKKTILDLIEAKSELQNLKVYDAEGTLKNGKGIWINPYGMIELKDVDNDGVKELIGTQVIKGVANYNAIGVVLSTWKWKKDKFVLIDAKVTSEKK